MTFSKVDTDAFPEPTPDELIPDIEARSYPVIIRKRSSSDRAYLISDPSEAKPYVGRIVLLKRGAEPVMAFRVIGTQPDKKTFVATRVRSYGNHKILEGGQNYTAIDRLTEIGYRPTPLEFQDELEELTSEYETGLAELGVDPSLDSYGRPMTGGAPNIDPSLDESLDGASLGSDSGLDDALDRSSPGRDLRQGEMANYSGLSLDEVEPRSKLKHSLSVVGASLRGYNAALEPAFYTSVGVKYAYTVGRMMIARGNSLQDTLGVELGLNYFTVGGFVDPSDSYTVTPFTGALRYTLFFSEVFGAHLYGGFQRSQAILATEATDEGLIAFNYFQPAFGGGLIVHLGPHWDIRADVGTDGIGAGLMVSF